MERAEWLRQMRRNAEALYDRFSPRYWVTWGLTVAETHRSYLREFLARVVPGEMVLSAACGAGRFDGSTDQPSRHKLQEQLATVFEHDAVVVICQRTARRHGDSGARGAELHLATYPTRNHPL